MQAKRHTLANALRVAAQAYADDAKDWKDGEHARTVAQFEFQASEAIALADAIEQAETIRLED